MVKCGSLVRVFIACLITLLLCACGAGNTIREPVPPMTALPDESVALRRLVFLVDSGAEPVYRQAAELFAAKAMALSAGDLVVEVRSSIQAVSDYTAGKAQLTFVDSRQNSAFCGDFATLAAPMRYRSYNSFTMALNADKLLQFVCDDLDAMLLAAYYQGTNQLISAEPLVDGALPPPEREGDIYRAALRSDSVMTQLLTDYGMDVVVSADAAERLQLVQGSDAMLAEFSPTEVNALDWESLDLYLLPTNHSMAPVFLTMDSGAFAQLTPTNRAVVRETTTYLFPILDNYYLDMDSMAFEELQAQGIELEMPFTSLQELVKRQDEEQGATDYRKKYLLSLVNGLN